MEDAKNKLKRSVRMKNLAQEINDFSANSNSLVTTTSSLLNPPTNIVFYANSTTSLTISWTAPTPTSSVLQVSRYIIERSFDNFQTSITSQTANTSITIQNLNPNLTYKFKIRAQNDVLVNGKPTLSLFSNVFTASTKWLLESPKNFTLVSKNNSTNTVNLKWDALVFTSSNEDEKLDGYEIIWSGQISYPNIPTYFVNDIKKVSSTITTITITELYPGIEYTFKVRAFNKSGVTTSFSNTVLPKIDPIINLPTNFNVDGGVTYISNTPFPRAVVTFEPPVTNYKIDGYEVYWYDSAINWNESSNYSLKYAFFENSNSVDYNALKRINIDKYIDFSSDIKVKTYTFRIRAVHYIPNSNSSYYLYLPDGFTGFKSLRAYGGNNVDLYKQIIHSNSTTMPSAQLPLNTNPPKVTEIEIEVINFTRAIVKWSPPDTFQPFDYYYVALSRDETFPNGQSGTSEIYVPKSTTSTEWNYLQGGATYYFRIGVKNIYDNVTNWSPTVAEVITPTVYKPENISKVIENIIGVRTHTIVEPTHHDRTFDETDNCFKVTMVSSTTSYDLEILRPIELFHDISIPGTWGGNIKITIDKDWNINMSFNTPDGWRQNNQWIYGRLAFQSGNLQRESDAVVSNESEYTRNVYYTNDTTYSNRYNNSTGREFINIRAFRKGDGNKNVSVSVAGTVTGSEPSLFVGTRTRRFTGNNPPGPDEKFFLNNPDDNSIYVLRYQVFLQGYYAGTLRDDMVVLLSGDLQVKLPGYKKIDTGYIRKFGSYVNNTAPLNPNAGGGFVYNRSDCGYPYVRQYPFGGMPGVKGSKCGDHLFSIIELSGKYTSTKAVFPDCKTAADGLSFADIIWYGVVRQPKPRDLNQTILQTFQDKVDSKNAGNMEYLAKRYWDWSERDLRDFKDYVNGNSIENGEDRFICTDQGIKVNPKFPVKEPGDYGGI